MARVGPGGRLPDHGVPLIGLRNGKPVFASSATGSGNVQASWQNAIRVLGFGRSPSDVANGPHLYSGRVRSGDFSQNLVACVREQGFPLATTEHFSASEIGYWVGAVLDPEQGTIRAACLQPMDGLAFGR